MRTNQRKAIDNYGMFRIGTTLKALRFLCATTLACLVAVDLWGSEFHNLADEAGHFATTDNSETFRGKIELYDRAITAWEEKDGLDGLARAHCERGASYGELDMLGESLRDIRKGISLAASMQVKLECQRIYKKYSQPAARHANHPPTQSFVPNVVPTSGDSHTDEVKTLNTPHKISGRWWKIDDPNFMVDISCVGTNCTLKWGGGGRHPFILALYLRTWAFKFLGYEIPHRPIPGKSAFAVDAEIKALKDLSLTLVFLDSATLRFRMENSKGGVLSEVYSKSKPTKD